MNGRSLTTIGARVRWARDRHAWTQSDLARASDVRIVTISRIETGRIDQPRQSTVQRLAAALGVDPGWLLTGEGIEVLHAAGSGRPKRARPTRRPASDVE